MKNLISGPRCRLPTSGAPMAILHKDKMDTEEC